MGDRWNAGGPGSVARASYVWLPLIPTAPPTGSGMTLVSTPSVGFRADLAGSSSQQSSIARNSTLLPLSEAPAASGQAPESRQDLAGPLPDLRLLDENAADMPRLHDLERHWLTGLLLRPAARIKRTLRTAAMAVACGLRRAYPWHTWHKTGCTSEHNGSKAESMALVLRQSWRPRDFLAPSAPRTT